MAQQQEIIPIAIGTQDSTAKQTVQQDSSADSLKKAATVKANAPKPKPKQAEQTAAVDSIAKSDSVIAEIPVVSLFTGHELKASNPAPVEKINFYPGWITIVLLLCMVMIAYLRASYPKRFAEFFRAVFDMRFASQLVREERVLSQRVSIFLTFIFFLIGSTFLLLLSNYFNVQVFTGNSFVVFGKIMLSVVLLFIFQVMMVELTGFIFNAQSEFSFYNFQVFLFNKALGLGLIPVVACLLYADAIPQPVFIYTGIIIFAINYLARLIRGLNIGAAKQGFNKFYLFFYFCTLEFLPVAVLAKIIFKHAT